MLTRDDIANAEYRYSHDPEFHARVSLTVRALESDLWGKTGQPMDPSDRGLVLRTACLALVAVEKSITTDVANAMADADHMPWLIQLGRVQ